MIFHDVLMTAAQGGGGPSWTPSNLGSSLLGHWDAERADKVTLAGSSVTTWTDIVANYAPTQGTGSAQPTYSATSFNGRPGITFDGGDWLGVDSQPFPSGANASEIWALVSQAALPADATARFVASYGGTATRRGIYRTVSAGANILEMTVGTAGGAVTASVAGDFSGIHVVRGIFSGTDITAQLDSAAGTPAAAVPNTGTTRIRLGTNTNNTPSQFFHGVINSIIITSALSPAQASSLIAYLNARGGIA